MRGRQLWVAVATWVACLALLGTSRPAEAAPRRHHVPDLRAESVDRGAKVTAVELPVTVHIATQDGRPVTSVRRIHRWVRRANRALAPFGIRVRLKEVRHMPEGNARITRFWHRRSLARYAPVDGSVHLFVVDHIDMPRLRNRDRRVAGLHWRYRGWSSELRHRQFVTVTADAPRTTFAHELGHLFGLGHSSHPQNVMCSCRTGQVGFSRRQGQRMRSGARRFSRR